MPYKPNQMDYALQKRIIFSNDYILQHLNKHLEFIKKRDEPNKLMKYTAENYKFKVITNQETRICFSFIKEMEKVSENRYEVSYYDEITSSKIIEQLINQCKIQFEFENNHHKKLKFTLQQRIIEK